MRTCANVAHGLGRRGGHEPLASAGEHVCDCLRDGDRVIPRFGYGAAHDEVVRCRDCAHYHERVNGCAMFGDEGRGEFAPVEPDGFCAWGERRAQ